tara:strand:- start:7138 stop:7431 length:294 start_codon:yes stop_codon:yes gene_type:complete
MIEPNLQIIEAKNNITKLIYTIKLKYQQKDGSYDIPEKSLETVKDLKETIELINFLYDFIREQRNEINKEKIQNLKSFKEIAELKNKITSLKRQIEL